MKSRSCRQLACPDVPGNDWTAAAVVVAYSVTVVDLVLDRSNDVILQRTEGLVDLLRGWLASTVDFETSWDLAFGRVAQALESQDVDVIDALSEVALRLMAQGRPGRWKARLHEQRRLPWAGRWLLPAASEIAVDSDGSSATVELTLQGGERWGATFRRDGERWLTEGAEQMFQVGARRPITLFSSDAVPRDMVQEDDFHSIFEFPAITPAIAQPFAAAFEILGQHTPGYLRWVEGVLRGVLVCRCNESRTRSSSWKHAPGISLMSWSANPIEIAEMLVHESSHQYYYIASRVGPVVDGHDETLHYSPAVQRNRPLDKILIGYHAFANILLFYRALLRGGLAGDPYCTAMEARFSSEVETLERPLRDSQVLSATGLDLFQPLMEQLRATRSGPGAA